MIFKSNFIKFLLITILVAFYSLAAYPQEAKPEGEAAKSATGATQRLTTTPMQLTEPAATPAPPAPQTPAKPATEGTSPSMTQGAAPPTPAPTLTQPSVPTAPSVVPRQAVPVQPTPTMGYTPSMVKTTTNYEFILDASGSMNGPMEMRTKLNILKEALKEALEQRAPLEMKRNLGLRTYGSEFPAEQNNCNDTKLLTSLGAFDQAALNTAIDSIIAKGTTPLAATLLSSEEDFPAREDVDNVIILITDGADSCKADMCAAASKIHNGPKKIIIHVVGFDLDQKAQEALACVAKNGDGQFNLARNEAELKATIDQAINATLPYNLRIKITAGTMPLPAVLTVYKAGTQQMLQEDKASGIKFYKLPAGTYDIKIEYTDSLETPKPTKLLKGVEVQETSKAEQVVDFNLGNVAISSFDQKGVPTETSYELKKAGTDNLVAKFTSGPDPGTFFFTPGKYDIFAESTKENLVLRADVRGITINGGETFTQKFEFQTGKLVLKGVDVSDQPIPIVYKITAIGSDKEITMGEAPKEGVTLELAPSKYDVYVQLQEVDVEQVPQTKVESVEIKGGETNTTTAKIITGILKLSGKDSKGKLIKTSYEVKLSSSGEIVAKTFSGDLPKDIHLAAGTYDVSAFDATSDALPPPSIEWPSVIIKEGETVTHEAIFQIGSLKIAAMNSKKVMIPGLITIYRAGSDRELVSTPTESDWKEINLTPGLYAIKAEDINSKEDPKPNVWFHDVEIVPNQSIAKEAVFRNGKIKLLCHGKNNITLTCQFNLFAYGMDTPLIAGETDKSWVDYEIPPGKYYIEAGYHDPEQEVLIKKWINVSVDDNEIVEELIRF